MSTQLKSEIKLKNADDYEQSRIEALHALHILDTPLEPSFDRITALTAELFDVPICTISLVDTNRIWLKSHYGLEINELERIAGFCATVIEQELPRVLPDTTLDEIAATNPLVTGAGARFYAGCPLTTQSGYRIGSLSILDFKPKQVNENQIKMLESLAKTVNEMIALNHATYIIHQLNEQLNQSNQRLQIIANHDDLTDLLNRKAVTFQLEKILSLSKRENKAVSLAMIDIDHFKKINDVYGHYVGDEVLIELSKRLKTAGRESDYIGRIGGEEFMVVMYPCDNAQAEIAAKRILSQVTSTPFNIESGHETLTLNVTVSIGICCSSDGSLDSARKLYQQADKALYKAKNNGRNQICV